MDDLKPQEDAVEVWRGKNLFVSASRGGHRLKQLVL